MGGSAEHRAVDNEFSLPIGVTISIALREKFPCSDNMLATLNKVEEIIKGVTV